MRTRSPRPRHSSSRTSSRRLGRSTCTPMSVTPRARRKRATRCASACAPESAASLAVPSSTRARCHPSSSSCRAGARSRAVPRQHCSARYAAQAASSGVRSCAAARCGRSCRCCANRTSRACCARAHACSPRSLPSRWRCRLCYAKARREPSSTCAALRHCKRTRTRWWPSGGSRARTPRCSGRAACRASFAPSRPARCSRHARRRRRSCDCC